MVGDNPASDMQSARAMQADAESAGSGDTWQGVLVKTGVWAEGDDTNKAAVVVDGVEEAVDWILQQQQK